MVGGPAGFGGVGWGEEGAGELEVLCLDEPEALDDVLALGVAVEFGAVGGRVEPAEDVEVEGACDGVVLLGESWRR